MRSAATRAGVATRPASIAAVVAGVLVFAFRVLSQRGFSNDQYLHLAWAQQLLLGDIPGRDFVDPGMPLAYGLSAAAQWLLPGPYSEVLLSSALFGLAAAATCLVVAQLTGSVAWGMGAALVESAFRTRAYGSPKVLVPAVTLLALLWYLRLPSRRRLTVLALWTIAAGLLRHDLGLYAVSTVAVGLAAFHGMDIRSSVRAISAYAMLLLLAALPYLAFLQATEGVAAHLHNGLEFNKSEQNQYLTELPPFPDDASLVNAGTWDRETSGVFLAYFARGLALAAPFVLLIRAGGMSPAQRAGAAGAIVFLWWFSAIILRHSLPARVPDLAAVLAIAGAWTTAEVVRVSRTMLSRFRPVPLIAGVALLAIAIGIPALGLSAVWVLGDVGAALRETHVQNRWAKATEVARARRLEGTAWPWTDHWPVGPMPEAVEYLASCTTASDRLLVTWRASEYYFFTRRGFAAGHSQLLAPYAFTAPADQALMVKRTASHRVPIVLINESFREEFTRTFPMLDEYLRAHYTPVGHFTIDDGSDITIATRADLHATSTYGAERWPCGFL